jgi:carbonic anhydrase/acetyltransferase-like protein (isoleucine patch superfamily)
VVSEKATLAPTCTLTGPVYISKFTRVWYSAQLRAEYAVIRIGEHCEIWDHAVIKTARNRVADVPESVTLGNRVTIGPFAIVGSSVIDDDVYIGGRSVISDGCKLERGVVIAPNTVLPPGSYCPAYSYWSGTPAKFVSNLSED